MKLDLSGNIVWQKFYGGNGSDSGTTMINTADGGLIVAGSTYSNNGDVGNNYGHNDWWVLKLDQLGNIEWENNYGGSDSENALSIIQSSDYGYLVVGFSNSIDNDLLLNNGWAD